MDYVGFATVRTTPVKTKNIYGDISEISGKQLPVIERNEQGDCLCMLEGKGIVDVDHVDVYAYVPKPLATLEQAIKHLFKL